MSWELPTLAKIEYPGRASARPTPNKAQSPCPLNPRKRTCAVQLGMSGRVSVRTELIKELPNVVGNRVQLQLVVRNLIVNAVEAMSSVTDRERVLHIFSTIMPSGVRVTVTDSGTGIDQDSIDRIFDTFFTTKSHGMGMGLSICRSIIEAHGGK